MISWIQRTFQQHFKWLFLALLILVIISFVFITNASSGFGHVAKQAPARPFYGLNLGSAEDTKELVRDATLSVQLHGMQMSNEGQFQQYALQRVAALHLASELNLPAPANDEVVRHIQSLRAFAGADGQFDAKRYTAFRDSLKTNPQLHESDVSRVIADDVTYQLVLKLLAGPGYVLPADVQQQLNRSDTTWTLQAVTIDYPSFKPTVAVTAEALGKFLEFNAGNYEIGPKAGVSYIEFAAAAYADKVSFTEANLRAYYDANVARFTKPAADKPAVAATPDADFAAARSQVEEAYKADRAKALADAAASDLAVALFDGKVTAATLDGFLAARQQTPSPPSLALTAAWPRRPSKPARSASSRIRSTPLAVLPSSSGTRPCPPASPPSTKSRTGSPPTTWSPRSASASPKPAPPCAAPLRPGLRPAIAWPKP
jgi:peptidyl-prolyl cis-trans isomerase D